MQRNKNTKQKPTTIVIGFYFGSPSWTRTNDTVSCGARRKTSLKRRFSVDRCAILPSLLLPPAALGHDAVNSLSAVCTSCHWPNSIWKKKIKTFKRTSLFLAPPVGLEPTTPRLTAACSTDWAMEECGRPLLKTRACVGATYLPGPSPAKYCQQERA